LPENIRNDEWLNTLSLLLANSEKNNNFSQENSESSIVNKFIESKCTNVDQSVRISIKKSYDFFCLWHKHNYPEDSVLIPTKKFLAKKLREYGYPTKKVGGCIYFFGLQLEPD